MELSDLYTEDIYIKSGNPWTPKLGCYRYWPGVMNILPLSSFILESTTKTL